MQRDGPRPLSEAKEVRHSRESESNPAAARALQNEMQVVAMRVGAIVSPTLFVPTSKIRRIAHDDAVR